MTPPETRYATSEGYSIAYQVTGEGPDLVFIPGFVSNIEIAWEIPAVARFFERLASFSRVISFDKRGTGLSDRVPADRLPTLEERIDDVRAVMDAAGSERATLLGMSEGGPMGVLFAATHPNRAAGLILYASYARREAAVGAQDQRDAFIERIRREWGTGAVLADRTRSVADDPGMRQLLARFERHSASPQAAAAIVEMGYSIDVTGILPSVQLPTLVLHRSDDPNITIKGAHALVDGIRGARLVEVPGIDHALFVGDTEPILAEIEEFMTGVRPAQTPERVLSTILFVDIVSSTEVAARMGDRKWRDLLDSFFTVTRAQLARHRGEEADTTGDGLLATFDGPARAVRCALDIRDVVRPLDLEVRAGLHTGEIEMRGDEVAGIGVHIGARVGAAAGPGEVWVSRTVKDLVAGSGIRFESRGSHQLKGVPQAWDLVAVVPESSPR